MDNAVSNIFAISGFDRINWLRFVGNLENTYNAFTDLLERDIASNYFKREISYGPNHADDENDSELWVFLFSGSLPELSSLTQLIKKESGTLKFGEGATHEGDEARISLLFGALKNLIQKVLHQNSFVRVSDFFVHLPDETSRAIDPSLLIFRDDECLDSITIKFFLMGGVICCYVSAFKTRLQQLDATELKSLMTQVQNKITWNKHVLTSTTGAIGQIKSVVESAEELVSQSKSWAEHLSHQSHALSQFAVKVQIGNSTFTFPSGLVFKIAPLRLPQNSALLEQFYAYEYAQRNDSTVTLLNNGFKGLSVTSKDGKFRKEVNFWKYKDPFLNLDTLPAPAPPAAKPKVPEVKNQLTPKAEEEDKRPKIEEPPTSTTSTSNPEPAPEPAVPDASNNNASNAAGPGTTPAAPPPTQPAAPVRPRLIFTAKKKLSQSQQGTAQPTTAVVPPPTTEVTPTPAEQKPAEPMAIESKFPMEKDTFDFDISKGLGNDDFDEWMMEIDKEKPKPKPVEPVVTKMEIDTYAEPPKPEPIVLQPVLEKSNSISVGSNPPTVPLASSTEEITVTRNNSEALLTAKQKQRTLYGLCPPDYQSLNNSIPKVSLKSSLTYTPANSKVTKSDLLSYSADPKSEMSDSASKQGNSDPKLGDFKERSSMLDNLSSDESDSESSSDSDSDEDMALDNPFDRDYPMDELNGDSSNPPPFTPEVKSSDVIKGNAGNKSSPLPHFELINPVAREDRGRGNNLITQLLSSRYRPVTAVKLTYVLDALSVDLHALDVMQHFKHYFQAYTPQHAPSFGSVGHSLTPQHTPYSLQVHSPGLYNQMSPTSQPSPSQFPRNPSTPSNTIKTPHTPGMTPIPYIKSNTPPGTQFALRDTQLQRLIEVIEQQALIGYDVSFDNDYNVGVLVDRAAQFLIDIRQQRQNWSGVYTALRDFQAQEEPNSWLLELILDPVTTPLASNKRLTDQVQSLLTNALQNLLRNTKSSIECTGPLSFNDWSLIGGGDKLVRALINNTAANTNNATPSNPFIEELKEPKFLVGYQEEWLEVPPKLLPYWEKANLEPYAPKKNVAYFVITPDNQFLLNQVITFFNELSAIYELCNLGKHKAANTPKFGEGIVFAPDMADSEDIISAEVKYNYASQFVESCKNLANHLCEDSVLNTYSDSCIVVYLVFPFDHVTKSPATQQNQALLYKCLASIAEITSKKGNLNLILQPIPIGHVIDKRADSTKVKALCFSVFNKSRRVTVMTNKSNHTPSTPTMSSHTNTVSTALTPFVPSVLTSGQSFKLFEPSTVLAPPNGLPEKSASDMPELFLDSKPAGSASQARDYFHFCYTTSDYGEWTAVCCTDARGEFLEARLLKTQRDMHDQATQLWSLCNKLLPLKRWHVVITKYGEFLPNELQEWQHVLSGPEVTYSDIILSAHVASLTFNRDLQFIFDTNYGDQLSTESFAFYPPHPTCHFDTSTVRPHNMNSLHSPATPSTPGNVPPSPPHVTRPLISAYLVAPTALQNCTSSLCPAQTVLFARLYLEHGRAEHLPNMHHVIRDFARECWALSWLDGPTRRSILPLHAAVAKRLARLSSVLQFFKVT